MQLSKVRAVEDIPLVVRALAANYNVKGMSYAVLQSRGEGGDRAYILQAPSNDRDMRLIASARGETEVTVAFRCGDGIEERTGTLKQLNEVSLPKSILANVLVPIGLTATAAYGMITTITPGSSLSAIVLGVAGTILGGFGLARFFLRAGNDDLAAAVIRDRAVELTNEAHVRRVESRTVGEAIPALPAPVSSLLETSIKTLERVPVGNR